jgi:UDP-glucose 4-epimerase
MKNILITGGSGFIGSNLVLYLSNLHRVTSIGRGKNQEVLRSLVNKNVNLVDYNAIDTKDLQELIKDSDIIIHLAGGGGNKFFVQNPDAIGKSIRLTDTIIEVCQLFNKKLIFTSSIAVYNTFTHRGNPLSESMRPLPEDIYGLLKLLSENMIKDSGVDFIILRLPNIYGYSLKFQSSGVIGRFIEMASKGYSIDIFTDGNNKMDYLFLDDLNRAFGVIIEKDIKNEIINIGSGSLHSLKEIAYEISSIFAEEYNRNVKVNIINKEHRVYADRLLSNEKAEILLGWTPVVSLKEGLRETVRRYMNDRINTSA